MATEMSISSFFCVILLVLFIPLQRVRTSVPHLAIILWLVGYNLIHGVNSIVWDGNVDIRVPVWCDIVTRFLLGTIVALPAAFLCIVCELELLASRRQYSFERTAVRNRRILEVSLCYALPLIYVSLHVVSQDHRFDLVKDYGCLPSIHNSSLALSLIWVPPIILCTITFILSCISIHHSSRIAYAQFVVDIESRASNMTSSLFFRKLSISLFMTVGLGLVSLFSVLSAPAVVPWSSWDSVHSQLGEVNIITEADRIKALRTSWWGFFVISVLYLLLSLAFGEETRDAIKWVVVQLRKKRQVPKLRDFQLPSFYSKNLRPTVGGSASNLLAKQPGPQPVQLELKSGWDDMLDTKTSRWKFPSRKNTPSPIPISVSPTPSRQSVHTDEDRAFMTSTLSYLGSPTAQSLGISPVPPFQAVAHSSTPPQTVPEIPPKPVSPPPPPTSSLSRTKPLSRTDVSVPSVPDTHWHVAPATRSRVRSASQSRSPPSSEHEPFGHLTVPPSSSQRRALKPSAFAPSDVPAIGKPLKPALKRPIDKL